MGIRLEFILIGMVVAIIGVTTMLKFTSNNTPKKISHKELEFKVTTFTEVDTYKKQSNAFCTYGVRENGILSLHNLKYSTQNIKELRAQIGIYKGSILYLDGDVVLNEKEGFNYSTQHAQYNQKTEILDITSPFIAKMDLNRIQGYSLRYNAIKKEAYGTKINAIFYTAKK